MAALVVPFAIALAEPAMPDSIVRVGATATPGWPWSVAYQDSYAYVGDRQALVIIDVTIPSNPSIVGILSTFHVQPVAVFVVDTVAHTIQIGPEFATASVGDPTSPYQLGWCPIPMFSVEPKGLMVVGSLAYVPDANRGLQVVDVSDPTAPAVIGSLDTKGIARDLHVCDSLVFVADGDSLQVVSVSDPTLPSRIGAVEMPSTCYDVFVVDTFAYAVCQSGFGFGSLEVVNVSDPSSPQIVASVDNIAGDPLDVWISGNFAYVVAADYWGLGEGEQRRVGGLRPGWTSDLSADIEGGLRVIDITDPLSPSLVASYDTPGDPRGVFGLGDLIFVADYDSLQILRHIWVGVEEKPAYGLAASSFRLAQNQPNPFASFTAISYELPSAGPVSLEIYDITGRLVRKLVDATQPAGRHTAMWDGKDEASRKLGSGIYFSRLSTESRTLSNKMLLVR